MDSHIKSATRPEPPATAQRVRLVFERGTLVAHGLPRALGQGSAHFLWDPRSHGYRAPAYRYPDVLAELRGFGLAVDDQLAARVAEPLALRRPSLRCYQERALEAWEMSGRRGIVVLPTGAGKTHVALAAIASAGRSALVIVPTRVLLAQWVERVQKLVAGRVAVFGDGSKEVGRVTVCTTESAYRHMDRFGERFGLLVVDEVHHFGAGRRVEALEMCSAVARLGLTATPVTEQAAVARSESLVGPVVCSVSIAELSGSHLAPFDVVRLYVEFSASERAAYLCARETFLAALRQFRRMERSPSWEAFVRSASSSDYGRRALRAFHESRRLVSTAAAKLERVGKLLSEHRGEPALVFTADNAAAYALSRELLIPALTCHIARKEREQVLERLREGVLRALVSARVLNEGVDLPEVRVGVIAGGALGGREHVQRVGRLLRPRAGKRAVVYELVVRDTHEVSTANRRQLALVS